MCAAEAYDRSSFADDEMQRNASAESGVQSLIINAVHWVTVMYYTSKNGNTIIMYSVSCQRLCESSKENACYARVDSCSDTCRARACWRATVKPMPVNKQSAQLT